MVVWMTQNWFLVALAGPFGFLVATWGGILGLSFGPVRNLFAFAFDGLIPAWANKVSRNGSPNRAVLLAGAIAWLVLTVATFTTWYNYITYTVTIWMVGWLILGIAAMVFPYVRKDIFEKSPQLVQSKLLGHTCDHHSGIRRNDRVRGHRIRHLPHGHHADHEYQESRVHGTLLRYSPDYHLLHRHNLAEK